MLDGNKIELAVYAVLILYYVHVIGIYEYNVWLVGWLIFMSYQPLLVN